MTRVFRGHPGLLFRALPAALVAVGVKAGLEALDWHPLDFNPLLAGVIAAEVFIIGFLLSGTTSDFKEAEHPVRVPERQARPGRRLGRRARAHRGPVSRGARQRPGAGDRPRDG